MKKEYRGMTVTRLAIQPEGSFLTASRPIEMEAEVKVTPFEDGNKDWSNPEDFTITFE